MITKTLEISTLNEQLQLQFKKMVESGSVFYTQTAPDEIWDLYLSSFPEGSNPIFRERTQHDCNCCKSFIRNAGNIIAIINGKLVSLWDLKVDNEYQAVADALSEYVKSKPIVAPFRHYENRIGTPSNKETTATMQSLTWHHMSLDIPKSLISRKDQIPTLRGQDRTSFQMLKDALSMITDDAIETVLDLIAQNSIYRGQEKERIVKTFNAIKIAYDSMLEMSQDNFIWLVVMGENSFAARIKNDVIGTLLLDLSDSTIDLEKAIKSYETKVAPSNYKRTTALITPKMVEQAKQTLEDLGLLTALERRFAQTEDISVSDILFVDRESKKDLKDSLFDSLPNKPVTAKALNKVEKVTIEEFITNILPGVTSIEMLFQREHLGNLVSLIAPVDPEANNLFKWNNQFSWSYNGEVTDSIKQRVKQAGGNVTGELCCRLAWFNTDDLDFWMNEPNHSRIYYGNKRSSSGGQLDVDMNAGTTRTDPVENIFYSKIPRDGKYILSVNQFSNRNTEDFGFEVEIDILGEVTRLSYPKLQKRGETIEVAQIEVKNGKATLTPSISTQNPISQSHWNIETNQFHKVRLMTLSPNCWGDKVIGNKHYFFILEGCNNPDPARGIYNEFLKSELEPHRKTMEVLGSKTKAQPTPTQLSGLGFSSTKEETITVKVTGTFTRTLEITF